MDSRTALRWTGAFVVIALFTLYIYVQQEEGEQQKLSSPSVFNGDTSGFSVFKTLADKTRPHVLEVLESAILEEKDLSGQQIVMLLSPSTPLSERESKMFAKYVKGGGTLFVGFHREEIWKRNLLNLRTALDIKENIKESAGFKNGQAAPVVAPRDSKFFRKGETYTFYSSNQFDGEECQTTLFDCFVKEISAGSGKVILLTGFAPFSNALIGRADNQRLALRLLLNSKHVLIDEYHHFFSSKTWGDLLLYLPFILPVGGLSLGLLLFFFFAHTRFYEKTLKEPGAVAAKSYHALSVGILDRMMGEAGFLHEAFAKQIQFLDNLFPERKEDLRGLLNKLEVQKAITPREKFLALIRFHQDVLKQKGRKM